MEQTGEGEGEKMRWEEGRGREGERGNRDSRVQISPEQMKHNENKKHVANGDKEMFRLRCHGQPILVKWHIHSKKDTFLFCCFYAIEFKLFSDTVLLKEN